MHSKGNKGENRRTRIIERAREEFFSKGFRSIDLTDLAQELGMSKKTLYVEFKNKRALIEAVLLEKMKGIQAELAARMKTSSPSFLGDLERFIACTQGHLNEIKLPFLRDLNRFYPELFEIVTNTRKIIIPKYFGLLVSRGQKNGAVRKDIPKKLIVEILLALADAIMNPAKLDELGLSPKHGCGVVLSVIMEGILTKKAGKPR